MIWKDQWREALLLEDQGKYEDDRNAMRAYSIDQ